MLFAGINCWAAFLLGNQTASLLRFPPQWFERKTCQKQKIAPISNSRRLVSFLSLWFSTMQSKTRFNCWMLSWNRTLKPLQGFSSADFLQDTQRCNWLLNSGNSFIPLSYTVFIKIYTTYYSISLIILCLW